MTPVAAGMQGFSRRRESPLAIMPFESAIILESLSAAGAAGRLLPKFHKHVFAAMMHVFLDREESIEQAYFFRMYRERLDENMPSQEILQNVREEVLATTKLPLALDFLHGEILLTGKISDGMSRLAHYFRPFQTYVMSRAEDDKSRFDQKTALQVLQRESE